MYSLLTGKFPFKGETNKDLYEKIKKGYFFMPEGISMECKALLLKMLQRDPYKRWGAA